MRNGMPNYTKLFSSIVTSTIWSEDDKTRVLWITMLAICDQHGEVHASIPGLARVAGISVEDCEIALAKFLAPDGYSRTKDHEGKRIAEIPGGWELLNHAKYRRLASKIDKDEANAARQARHRARNASVTPSNASVTDESDKQKQKQDTEAEIKRARPSGYAVPACFEKIEGFAAALAGWIESRRLSRKPATGRAIQLLIDRLSERPADAVAALNTATERSWLTIKWDWFDNANAKRNATHQRADSNRNVGHNANLDYSKRSPEAQARIDRQRAEAARAVRGFSDEGQSQPANGA